MPSQVPLYNEPSLADSRIRYCLKSISALKQTQTPSSKGLREGRGGSDRIKSSDPFLRAVASAEETLEDRDAKIWAHSSGMEDVWRCSQHSLLPASSPPTHSPTLIELFASPPVIVARTLNSLFGAASLAKLCVYSHDAVNLVYMKPSVAEELQKDFKREEEEV